MNPASFATPRGHRIIIGPVVDLRVLLGQVAGKLSSSAAKS